MNDTKGNEMNTCTMQEVYDCDDLCELIGYLISNWNGEKEIENWDGGMVIVENGIIIEAYRY